MRCTLVNPFSAFECMACRSLRPRQSKARATLVQEAWECTRCLCRNEQTASFCRQCEHQRTFFLMGHPVIAERADVIKDSVPPSRSTSDVEPSTPVTRSGSYSGVTRRSCTVTTLTSPSVKGKGNLNERDDNALEHDATVRRANHMHR